MNFLSPETIRDVKSGHEQANISNFFVRIDTDETVTIIVNKSEIGQGVYTAMRILVAEALACDWKKVGVEAASVDPVCNHTEWGSIQETGGSSSMRSEWELFRKALAVVREMLLAAAAKIWKVNKKSYRTENGKIIHTSGKSLSYGEQSGITAVIPLPKQINSKNTGSFKIIGKPVKRLGNPYPDFVTEAVHVAKALGKPVKVIQSHEDDIRGGYYHPMSSYTVMAALGMEGNTIAWRHTIVGQSILESNGIKSINNGVDFTSVEGAKEIPYDSQNILVDLHSLQKLECLYNGGGQ